MPAPSFNPGDAVVWRSCQFDHIGYVLTAFVLVDTPDLIALFQPAGAPVLRRGGKRRGPNGRSLPPGGWDGTHRRAVFNGPPAVRAHQPGSSYSVIRHLVSGQLAGWYANPELPWVRTSIGYDSKDLIVDVTFNGGALTEAQLKDLDELDWNLDQGTITPAEHAEYLAAAHQAVDDANFGRGVFSIDWDRLAKVVDGYDDIGQLETLSRGELLEPTGIPAR